MRKTILTLCLATLLGASATAQTQVMSVYKNDGSKQTFKVSQVERVTFEQKEYAVLNNQFAINDKVSSIGSVLEVKDANGYTFALYEESGKTAIEDTPAMSLYVSTEALGKETNLATAASETARVSVNGVAYDKLEGTLKISFDKFQKNVTIALDCQTESGEDIRANYSGAFSQTYIAENTFSVAPNDGNTTTYDIPSVLCVKAASIGEPTSFAFSNIKAATAEEYLACDYAVWFTLSSAKLYKADVDLSSEKDSYTFRFIDYATGTVYEDVASGVITTAQNADSKVYFKFTATLENGTTVTGEYFGPTTDVEGLDDMIPMPVLPNEYTYYDASGNSSIHNDITNVKIKKSTSLGYTTLYFMPDGASYNDTYTTPQLQFGEHLVNAGKISLAELKDGDLFSIKFNSIQLTSPDAKYMGYSNIPDNGTLSITRDENGTYDIYLEVTNLYTNAFGPGGDSYKLVLSYKGAVTE